MIEFRIEGHKVICIFKAEIVASNIPEMRTILTSYLDNEQSWRELVFDCENVHSLDSIGINFIVGAFKKADNENSAFKMIGCNDTIVKVIKLFRLDEKFPVEPG